MRTNKLVGAVVVSGLILAIRIDCVVRGVFGRTVSQMERSTQLSQASEMIAALKKCSTINDVIAINDQV